MVTDKRPGQSERQRRQTDKRRRAKLLYDTAEEAGGVERALAQLDLAAVLTDLAALADRIRADVARLGDVEALARAVKDASELERAARSEMEAAQTVRAHAERAHAAAARERDDAVPGGKTPMQPASAPKPSFEPPSDVRSRANEQLRERSAPAPSRSPSATPRSLPPLRPPSEQIRPSRPPASPRTNASKPTEPANSTP